MRNFLKGILVILIIVMLGMLGYTGWYYYKDRNKKTSTNNPQQVNNTPNQKSMEDKKEEKKESKKENKKEKIEEEQKEEEKKKEENSKEEGSLSDEDKALDLAKKQYGTTDGVYFRVEQIQSNGVYIISVRDNETTRDYAWYTVDVNNNTVK